MGYPESEALVNFYAGSSTEAVFTDSAEPSQSAWTAFGAAQDDLFVIDAQGLLRHHVNLHSMNLIIQSNRDTVDGWVRPLLSHLP